jgi:hypothetical protein
VKGGQVTLKETPNVPPYRSRTNLHLMKEGGKGNEIVSFLQFLKVWEVLKGTLFEN